MALKNTLTYIVCPQSAMIRLDRRSPNIINMLSEGLSITRRVVAPLQASEIVALGNVIVFHDLSSKAVELVYKNRDKVVVVVLNDTPNVSQLTKLQYAHCIVLKNEGLYQVYRQGNEVCVKAENECRVYKQGDTNVVPVTNPIEPMPNEPTPTPSA